MAPANTPPAASGSGPAPVFTPVPLRPDEPLGNRIARARTAADSLEFGEMLGLLVPLHDRPEVPPTLGLEAAMLETAAWVALRRNDDAIGACRRAVVFANYDPTVAREQSPQIQAACNTAAAQARRALVAERGIAIRAGRIETGPVAWMPSRIELEIAGRTDGLTVQAEVTIGDAAPTTVTFAPSAEASRALSLDANLSSPGAQIRVRPIVRDAFGELVRAESVIEATVPSAEAAIRFALGSDEGPLTVDGRATGTNVRIGALLPLSPGGHALEVRTPAGVVTRARVQLRRGEVTLLTLHGTAGSAVREVLRFTTLVGGGLGVAVGGLMQFVAYTRAEQLSALGRTRDEQSGIPTIRYSDVADVEASRALFQSLAWGFFIGGATLGVASLILWTLPPPGREAAAPSRATTAPRVGILPTPQGAAAIVVF